KRYAAFFNTLDLHRLRRRMVYLEDRQGVGKSRAAKHEAIQPAPIRTYLLMPLIVAARNASSA
ncbi:hypothetical protein, partial [Bradyrhizobium sp. 145]|uniref:hypothetical protein n=1 Tax=Bradyrhizobium sp. 145 TaxID=2782621 RepID=UPI001FFBB77B